MKHKLLENLVIFVSVTVAFVAGAFLVLKAPQIHSDYIRSKTEANVLLMHTSEESIPMGTGFVFNHGDKQVVLTNAHICKHIEGPAIATTKNNAELTIQIIKVDKVKDLCMLEILESSVKFDGLDLADDIKLGQEVMVTGHPRVLPYAINRGQLIGVEEVPIPISMVFTQEQYDACLADPNQEPIQTMMGWLCFQVFQGMYTTVLGMPGNSGSPVVDFNSDVIGVVFAANEYGWMILVPFDLIKEFLKD